MPTNKKVGRRIKAATKLKRKGDITQAQASKMTTKELSIKLAKQYKNKTK